MAKTDLERDEKGDIRFDYSSYFAAENRWKRYTYVFSYYHKQKGIYVPHFGLFSLSDERLDKARKDRNYSEVRLYSTPDHPPYDFFIRYHNWQLGLLTHFFKEVFEERAFIEGYQPQHKFTRLILPKTLHHDILNCINEFCLLPIRDLLLEVIATAQHKYIDEIAFWERPEMQRLIDTAERQTREAIRLVEKTVDKKWMHDPNPKPPAELLYVNFVFGDETVKIEHPWLAKEFVEHFKEHYDQMAYKNWKLDLARYPDRFEEQIRHQQFKYWLAISLYNIFTQRGFFKLKKNQPYPNDLMLCIARILEFCLIKVGNPDDADSTKIKHVRNWLRRKNLQPMMTSLTLPPDKERLLHYFQEDFLDLTGEEKGMDALATAAYIAKRFEVEHLIGDLAHLAQILKETWSLSAQQMDHENNPWHVEFDEYKAFKILLDTVQRNGKVKNIKFSVEGENEELELSQRLPLYLIEQALRAYKEERRVEFENDAIPVSIERTKNGYKIMQADHFNLPEERFFVKLIKQLYNYLLSEAPPKENDPLPSERYYAIIANLLEKTWFFYHQMNDERSIIQMVKGWHNLALNGE